MATNEKLVFRLINLFKTTPAEVVRVQTMIKGSTALGALSAYFGGDNHIATLSIGGVGFICDILLSCISIEKK